MEPSRGPPATEPRPREPRRGCVPVTGAGEGEKLQSLRDLRAHATDASGPDATCQSGSRKNKDVASFPATEPITSVRTSACVPRLTGAPAWSSEASRGANVSLGSAFSFSSGFRARQEPPPSLLHPLWSQQEQGPTPLSMPPPPRQRRPRAGPTAAGGLLSARARPVSVELYPAVVSSSGPSRRWDFITARSMALAPRDRQLSSPSPPRTRPRPLRHSPTSARLDSLTFLRAHGTSC